MKLSKEQKRQLFRGALLLLSVLTTSALVGLAVTVESVVLAALLSSSGAFVLYMYGYLDGYIDGRGESR